MTHNVRRFRVGLPSDEHVMGMTTASCIVIKGKGKDGSVAVRPYTPTTTNDTKVRFVGGGSLRSAWCARILLWRSHKFVHSDHLGCFSIIIFGLKMSV